MHISVALVTIYFTYVNKFKVSEILISLQIFCVQTRSTATLTKLYTGGPPAYRPLFMLALTMKRLSTPGLNQALLLESRFQEQKLTIKLTSMTIKSIVF